MIWKALRPLAVLACFALALAPYPARAATVSLVNTFRDTDRMAELPFLRIQRRFWNFLILGFVFYLGLPLSKLLLKVFDTGRLAPREDAPSYWVPRETPEEFASRTTDPF